MTDSLTVITNNVPRDLLDGYQLTPAERDTFDYLDWTAIDEGTDSATFFRYKGTVHDLGEYMRVEPGNHLDAMGWQGISSDTFFSATVIKITDDGEGVIVGRVYA